MGDAVLDRHFRHLQGLVKRVRTVIESGKNVAMDIDHQQAFSRKDIRLSRS